jgi:hypothetical protein
MDYRLTELEPPTAERMEALAAVLRSHGLDVHVGS